MKHLVLRLAAVAAVVASGLVTVPPPPATAALSPQPVLRAVGSSLEIAGRPVKMTGFAAYSLATEWGVNHGCGGEFSDAQLSTFFTSLPPHSLVTFDAFQSTIGLNAQTGKVDWSPLDRVFAAAAAAHVYVVPVLANEWGGCDANQYKDLTWFQNRFRNKAPAALAHAAGIPVETMSYLNWVRAIVGRYRHSPAVGMWQPVGEPSASSCGGEPVATEGACNKGAGPTCSESTALRAMVSFATSVGQVIRTLDRIHLIDGGTLGGSQCGENGYDWMTLGASRYINVLCFHDYYNENGTLAATVPGGDASTGVIARMRQAGWLHKPLMDGEFGVRSGAPCASGLQRSALIANTGQMQLHPPRSWFVPDVIDVFLVWDYEVAPASASPAWYSCRFSVFAGDPAVAKLAKLVK